MSSPRLVIRMEISRGELDAGQWSAARKIIRWRLHDGVESFLAAAMPCERRSQVEVSIDAEVRE